MAGLNCALVLACTMTKEILGCRQDQNGIDVWILKRVIFVIHCIEDRKSGMDKGPDLHMFESRALSSNG